MNEILFWQSNIFQRYSVMTQTDIGFTAGQVVPYIVETWIHRAIGAVWKDVSAVEVSSKKQHPAVVVVSDRSSVVAVEVRHLRK